MAGGDASFRLGSETFRDLADRTIPAHRDNAAMNGANSLLCPRASGGGPTVVCLPFVGVVLVVEGLKTGGFVHGVEQVLAVAVVVGV